MKSLQERWCSVSVMEYLGKTGIPHTPEDYESFKLWEKSVLVAFLLAFAANIGLAILTKQWGRSKEL